MKTLKDHIILYDADCPLCKVYTKAFIQAGMLDKDGREPYQQMPEQLCPLVDMQRAVNEIALVNTKTGEVSYGVHSLFKIIANSFPMFKSLFSFQPFIWLMSKLYAFISYNRRVIIPSGKRVTFDTIPSFHLGFRIAYIVFAWWLASFILSAYAPLLTPTVPLGDPYREYYVCAGQLFFQGIVIQFWAKHKTWDYLGNMITISLGGSLMLLIGMIMSRIIEPPALAYVLYFLFIAGAMLLEHIRRSKLMRIGWLMTITWVVYRALILFIVYYFN